MPPRDWFSALAVCAVWSWIVAAVVAGATYGVGRLVDRRRRPA